jgi:hypothetical protein
MTLAGINSTFKVLNNFLHRDVTLSKLDSKRTDWFTSGTLGSSKSLGERGPIEAPFAVVIQNSFHGLWSGHWKPGVDAVLRKSLECAEEQLMDSKKRK